MNKIKSISMKLRITFQVAFIVIPVVNILVWMFYDQLPQEISITLLPYSLNLSQININMFTKTLACLASMLQVSIILYALRLLIKLFRNYEQHQIFSSINVKYYRRLGYAVFSWVICNKVVEALISLILTFQNPIGHRMIAVRFTGGDLVALAMGALIILIAWIMHEGQQLQEEQALTI